jgi:hypothetical protein
VAVSWLAVQALTEQQGSEESGRAYDLLIMSAEEPGQQIASEAELQAFCRYR